MSGYGCTNPQFGGAPVNREWIDQPMAGGERPESARKGAASGTVAGSVTVAPASWSQNRVSPAGSLAASADDPTVQVVQCVVDLRWQTMSWCASGISTAANT